MLKAARSQAVEQLRSALEAGQDSVCYFYCSFDDLATQDPVNILASFIVQISVSAPCLLDKFMADFAKAKGQSAPARPNVEQLEDAFIECTKDLPRIFLLLDALNECQDAVGVADLFLRLAHRCRNLRILITSTQNLISRGSKGRIPIRIVNMDTSSVNEDISVFVDDVLAEAPGFEYITKELRTDIRNTVTGRAEGM